MQFPAFLSASSVPQSVDFFAACIKSIKAIDPQMTQILQMPRTAPGLLICANLCHLRIDSSFLLFAHPRPSAFIRG
jgi:hypothetical protein